MVILGLEFLALIVICYVYFIYATRDQVSKNKKKLFPSRFMVIAILIFLAMILFTSWYVSLGLAS